MPTDKQRCESPKEPGTEKIDVHIEEPNHNTSIVSNNSQLLEGLKEELSDEDIKNLKEEISYV